MTLLVFQTSGFPIAAMNFSMNFVFIKDVAVIIQSNFSRNTDNLGVKYSFAVFVSVSFSPLIRPFLRVDLDFYGL